MQLLFPFVTSAYTYAASQPPVAVPVPTQVTSLLAAGGTETENGSNGLKSTATSMATGAAANSVEEWLSHFGTAEVNLNTDENGNWDNSSIDFLAPLYDNKKSVLFTQLGLRAPDGRTTGNIGMGVRSFNTENWMFGGNVFFDDDFTGKNRRVGIGAEAWTDYLKLAANSYIGTTEWHSSRDFADYNEKPADGFDIRAEGYLPAYPQLGAKVMYEQYYGENVALFDKDHLQNDPSAVTMGLNYTPISLVTAGIDYKRGQDSQDDVKFSLNFRYAIGESWSQQTSADQVALRRSLAGSRYDLVNRNNEIILQYKKKDAELVLADMTLVATKDHSPADGTTANMVTLQAITSDHKPVPGATIAWAVTGGAQLSSKNSVTDANGDASVSLTNTTAEQVSVTASSGGVTRAIDLSFTQSVASLGLVLTKNHSKADGIDQNIGQVTVKDASGKVLPGIALAWHLDNGAVITSSDNTTNADGQATVHFTSTKAGLVKLSASAEGKTESINADFASPPVSSIEVSMTTNNAIADGSSTDVAQAQVTDSAGLPIPDTSVTWTVSGSAIATTATVVNTDNNGKATLKLTDSVAENVVVTVTAEGKTGSTTALFSAAPVNNVSVNMVTNNVQADGSTPDVARAVVKDANGQPMADTSVTWTVSGNAKAASATTVNTDTNGVATLNLTDTVAENVAVNAVAEGKSGSATATFTAIPVDSVAVTMKTNDVYADGSTPNVAQAVVKDASGQPMADTRVSWTVSGSAKAASATTVNTDANGVATLELTDTVAESVIVNAAADGKSGNATAIFTPLPVNSVTVTMKTNNVQADGSTPDVAQAVVKDANGQPMADTRVTWTISGNAKAVSATTVNTDTNGVATLDLTDSVVESVTVTATADDKSGSDTAIFSAIPVDKVAVTITTDNSPADNGTTNAAQALVTDAKGQPMANVSVNWAITGSTTATAGSPETVMTNTSGIAVLTLKDSEPEVVTVTANAGGKSDSATTTFTPREAKNIALKVTEDNAIADNTAINTVQATVDDGYGKPIKNVSVTWSIGGSSTAKLSTPAIATTDENGIVTVSLTDPVAEPVHVIASSAGLTNTTSVTFVPVPVGDVAVTMTTDNSPADNETNNIAQAKVTDAKGQPMADVSVTWAITGSTTASTSSAETVTTDASGIATLKLKDSVPESVTVTANAGGQSGSTTTTFVAREVATITLTATGDNAIADNTELNTVQALVKDGNDKPIQNANVSWSISGSSTATLSTAVMVTTDANGIANVSLKDSQPESVNVTASSGGISNTASVTFTPVPAASVVVTMTTPSSPADGSTPNVAQALVTDAKGQPMANVSVSWTMSGKAQAASATTVNTDANGIATFSLTDTTMEFVTVTATAAGLSGSAQAQFSGLDVDHLTIVTLIDGKGIRYGQPNEVEVTAYDTKGQPMQGVGIKLTSGSTSAYFTSPDIGVTDGSGKFTAYVMASIPGGTIITATTTNSSGAARTAQVAVHFTS
nr:inverse autotransporter beta-barrel domain-containing protein [Citrobacter youngae]